MYRLTKLIIKELIKYLVTVLLLIFSASQYNIQAQAQAELGENLFEGQIAPLLDGMGQHNFETSIDNEWAQKYFNQGVALTYGFNHLEAGRSYQQVVELEPNAAIAYWGQALVLGRNINASMEAEAVEAAYNLVQKAVSLKNHASAKEQALIDALAVRYSLDVSLRDRSDLDVKYAEAMEKVAKKYPNDPNIQTLYASALMNLHPWDFWNGDGTPRAWTPEILRVLESGLEKNPTHAGLIHYYIHAVEASKNAGRAMNGADILGDLIPGSGHIVHMPSHIYIRTGRYHDGVMVNERAMMVDNNYITQCRQQGVYPLAYVPHNRHFLWSMATLEGSSQKAISAAEMMASHIDTDLMRQPGLTTLQHYWVTPMYAYVRFGKWDKILNLTKPAEDLLYPTAIWHYARGIAYTAQGEFDKAQSELNKLEAISRKEELKEITVWEINNAYHVVQIAKHALEGELSSKQGLSDQAIAAFNKAISLEEDLNYNEPSDWHYPVRQSLGAALIEANKFNEAEHVYKADLETFPENGWSLFGLYKSLEAQGKVKEAEDVKGRFKNAWKWADFELEASRVL